MKFKPGVEYVFVEPSGQLAVWRRYAFDWLGTLTLIVEDSGGHGFVPGTHTLECHTAIGPIERGLQCLGEL